MLQLTNVGKGGARISIGLMKRENLSRQSLPQRTEGYLSGQRGGGVSYSVWRLTSCM